MIGIGVLFVLVLAAYGVIWLAIQAERQTQAMLADQEGPLQAAAAIQQTRSDLLPTRQAELATLEAQRLQLQFALPSEVDSTEVLAHIVNTAAAYDVNLRQLRARNPYTETVGTGVYQVFPYELSVEGEMEPFLDFLAALEEGPISTLALDRIRIEVQPTPTPAPARSEAPFSPYRLTLIVRVSTRLAGPETTPLPPAEMIPSGERSEQLESLIEMARQEGDWSRVISLLLALRVERPDDPELDAQLVEAYVQDGRRRLVAGQLAQAEADFRAALEIDPQNRDAQEGLAQVKARLPTATPTITPTPKPTATPTPAPTPLPYSVLSLQFGPNTRYPALGCNWFGFFGQVTDRNGYPVSGVIVAVRTAEWPGVQAVTSASGEYEVFLDNHPKPGRWLVQLYEHGMAVSPTITVDSKEDCNATLIRLDWRRGY